ncbi:MAG: N-acetylmuramoyl-L-alanine amidase [bacterium]|nr:N-acetylmuramoyl-L-alanine amidase [bacterium]
MSGHVTRRTFLAGVVGAAVAAWALLRDRGLATDTSAGTTTPPTPTSTPDSTAVTQPPATTTITSTTTSTTSAPPAVRIEALCRDAWGAAEPQGEFTPHEIEQLTVHHTARLLPDNRNAPAAVLGHQRFHQLDRGWPDIAYHFIVDLEGNVYECRPVDAVGDTGTNYDPTGHLLVCCEGNFNDQQLPAAQEASLVNVLAWASAKFGAASTTIRGHRDLAATTCPGDNLYPSIESGDLAAAVEAVIATGGVELEVVCGAAAADRIKAIEA